MVIYFIIFSQVVCYADNRIMTQHVNLIKIRGFIEFFIHFDESLIKYSEKWVLFACNVVSVVW